MTMNHDEKIDQMRDYSKYILVATFIKETQVTRSISSSNRDGNSTIDLKKFNKELLISIIKLRKLVDNNNNNNLVILDHYCRQSRQPAFSIDILKYNIMWF